MQIQEALTKLYNINWALVQADDPGENERVTYILSQLERSPNEAMRGMIEIIEHLWLKVKFPNGFFGEETDRYTEDKFQRGRFNLTHFPTKEYKNK